MSTLSSLVLFVSSLINMFIFLLPTPNFILASYSFVRSPSSCFLSVSVFRLPGMFRERHWARTQKMARMDRKDQGFVQCSNQPFPSIHFISACAHRDNRAIFTFSTCWCRCSELQDLRVLLWPQLAAVVPCSLGVRNTAMLPPVSRGGSHFTEIITRGFEMIALKKNSSASTP